MPAQARPSASRAKPPTSQAVDRGACTAFESTVCIRAILLTAQLEQTSAVIAGKRFSKSVMPPAMRTASEIDSGGNNACAMGR